MRFLPLTALLGGLCALHALNGQAPAASYKGPVHAKLLKYINVRHLQPGSSVFARVTADWSGLNCTLRKGAIIEANVEAAVPHVKHGRGSELALSFPKAQCSGADMVPLDFFLAAISYVPPSPPPDTFPVVRYMLSPARTPPGSSPGDTMTPFSATSQETMLTKADEFRAMRKSPESLKLGEVYGIKGVTMQLGAGPHGSSLLTAKKRDIALDENDEFVLVPVSLVSAPTGTASGSHAGATVDTAAIPRVSSAAPAPPEEFEPCAPPACNTDLPAAATHVTGHPVESIAVRPLGYAPRPRKTITQLDNDEALAWLGPNRLLVAFNPHNVIYRDEANTADAPTRAIRAVLLDLAEKRVVSTAYWELSDSGKYLWQISGDRILAHVANELRVYDAQFEPLARLPLAGPLGFVRISPNGKVVAVAVLKERYTPELHAKLRENLGHDPQEDVDVLILDENFKTIAHVSTASDILPPTLLNEGQVSLLAQPNHRYRLSLLTWDNQTRTLARFSSACTPQLSTFAPDLVFVRTCEKTYGAPEIRILRANGQVVMHGKPDVGELGYEAKGNSAGQTFALKVLHTAIALPPDGEFHGSDLNAVELRVYRATDGKRLSTIRTAGPPASHDGYCLSPDGSQIAVLAGAQINIFPVPTD